MMSLPPPAAKPTMMWMGLLGYLAGSSWARAGGIALAASARNPRKPTVEAYRFEPFMESPFGAAVRVLERRDVNMQHGGLAVIKCGEAAVDGCGEFVRLADGFAMGAECASDRGEITLLALPAGRQPRLKLVGFGGKALRVHPLHRRFHRLPAAIVQHHGQDRDLILLRHRIEAGGRREMKSAVADHLYDTAIRLRQFEPQRHATAEAEPAAGEPDIGLWLGARDVLLQHRS